MKLETKEGTMEVIRDNNTTIEKLEISIKGLEELITQDKANNDIKSLKYHTLALEDRKNQLKEVKEKANNI